MNRFTRLMIVPVFGLTLAWAQAPTQQSAAPAQSAPAAAAQSAAPSQQANVTGCLTQWFGQYSVADAASSKAWQVKGNETEFAGHENHVVKVQGLPDPKAPSPLLYAQSVQDTGQACGNVQASSTTQPGAAPAAGAATATSAATTGATATPSAAQSAPQQQPGGGVAQPGPTASPSSNPAPQATTPQTSTPEASPQQQGGVSGTAAGSTTPQAENKGTPEAASPQGAVASNSAQPANDDQVFTGCLGGAVNAYQLKGSNGKIYHLQGNTGTLGGMVNHNVELTGEDFNGKAIQVNGARDLGGSCKAK